jgi:hypothetical protein
METKFYTTKLLVEIEVSTQFGPTDAVNMIEYLLINVPAIKSVNLTKLETDYKPVITLETNYQTIIDVPKKLK